MDQSLLTDNKVVGLKQSKKAVESGKVKIAYVAHDADEYISLPFEELCRQNNVNICRDYTMKELAKKCNVDVPTAIAAVFEN